MSSSSSISSLLPRELIEKELKVSLKLGRKSMSGHLSYEYPDENGVDSLHLSTLSDGSQYKATTKEKSIEDDLKLLKGYKRFLRFNLLKRKQNNTADHFFKNNPELIKHICSSDKLSYESFR